MLAHAVVNWDDLQPEVLVVDMAQIAFARKRLFDAQYGKAKRRMRPVDDDYSTLGKGVGRTVRFGVMSTARKTHRRSVY